MDVTVVLYLLIPKGFFPQQDTGNGLGQYGRHCRTSRRPRCACRSRRSLQDRRAGSGRSARSATTAGSSARQLRGNFYIIAEAARPALGLHRRRYRRPPAAKLAAVVGAMLYLQVPQDIKVGGRGGATQYQYTPQDANLDELNSGGAQARDGAARGWKQLADVTSDQQANAAARRRVTIDRDRDGRFGVQPTLIDRHDLRCDRPAPGGRSSSPRSTPTMSAMLEVDPALQGDPRLLDKPLCGLAGHDEPRQVPVSYFMRAPTWARLAYPRDQPPEQIPLASDGELQPGGRGRGVGDAVGDPADRGPARRAAHAHRLVPAARRGLSRRRSPPRPT